MSIRGFGVSIQNLEIFFANSGEVLRDNFVVVFPSNKKHEVLEGKLLIFNFGLLVFMSCVNYIVEKKKVRFNQIFK